MYESRAYDNHHGDPVVVLVVTGTHDVSRLVGLLQRGTPVVEQLALAERITRQVRRHTGGHAALKLLADHGGPNLLALTDDDTDRLTRERDTAMARADHAEARISEARALLRAGVAERAAILRALDTDSQAAGTDPTPEVAP